MPEVMTNPHLRSLVVDSDFIEYHTSAAATAKLVQKVMGELGYMRPYFISNTEKELVDEPVEDRWSPEAQNVIPMEVRGVTRAYLDALNALPGNLYQGDKALQAVPMIKYRAWVAFFKKWAAFSSSTAKIDAATNLGELMANTPSGLFRHSGNQGDGGEGGPHPRSAEGHATGGRSLTPPVSPTMSHQEEEGDNIPIDQDSDKTTTEDPLVALLKRPTFTVSDSDAQSTSEELRLTREDVLL
ncbi:hypothetical protein QYM36_013921 [Artemia franciscana]|uniref:Uncharacterized protein n=1 Tax=Artemia franciscana TaxID=6661 RepID=A0AA88HB16_ARTSF|nr:hypothetical protein QYM36_013921 [Artemia franciscana]